MNINKLKIEKHESANHEIESYLNEAILNYGSNEINDEKPYRLYCVYRNQNNKIIAGAMGNITKNMFLISHLFVEALYRNKGIGHKLLKNIEKMARDHGASIIRLNSLNNKTANLYSDSGYKITAKIENYIEGFHLVYYHKNIN